MNRIYRITALLLAALMLSAVFAACGKTTTTGQKEPTEPPTDSGEADLPEGLRFDESGTRETVRFLVADDTKLGYALAGRSIEVAEEDKDANGINSTISDRNTTVENTLGVDIILDEVVYIGEIDDKTQEMLSGGIDYYDVIGAFQYYSSDLAIGSNSGNYLNYQKLDDDQSYLDLDKDYWEKDVTNTMAYGGASYWITGDISLYYTGGTYVTYVNARLWQNYAEKIAEITGYSDVYEVVNNGKWTFENMCKIIKECWIDRNGNEKVDKEDQSGYIGLSYYDLKGLFGGFHYTFTKWVDGKPQLDIKKDMTYDVYDKFHQLLDKSNAYIYDDFDFYNQTNPYVLTLFANGSFLFCIDCLFNSEIYLSDMSDDYYIIPCPLYNEAQFNGDGYSSILYTGTTLMMLPYTNENIKAATATLELMAAESYANVTPAYYETALKTRYVRGDVNAAGQIIDMVREGLYFDFIQLYCSRVYFITEWFTGRFISSKSKQMMSSVENANSHAISELERLVTDLEASTNVVR